MLYFAIETEVVTVRADYIPIRKPNFVFEEIHLHHTNNARSQL